MDKHNSVLVVEDDPDLREALCDTLRLSNYQVFEACDAETALKLLAQETICLVISDVQMPGMDGHELLNIVNRRHPGIPFVLITFKIVL